MWEPRVDRALGQGIRAIWEAACSPLLTTRFARERLAAAFDAERARWVLWLPVGLGAGIALYFALPMEPSIWVGPVLLAVSALGRLRLGSGPLSLGFAVFCVLAVGFTLASWRTASVSAPIIERAASVTVVGRVLSVERRANGSHRVLLETAAISHRRGQWEEARLPKTVRVSFRKHADEIQPGDWIEVRARLRPPPPPVTPDGFDFARQAFYRGLGGVGYAIGPPQSHPPLQAPGFWDSAGEALAGLRHAVSTHLRAAAPGGTGAILAALVTGDRSGIPEADIEALRDAGLAHLLAISGLHMAAVTSLIFFIVRFGLAAIEPIALSYPIKKWAAAAAILGGLFYLFLSGASISTQRAFVMMALMMLAILLDRPALSMRTVAWAATVVLVMAPESLLSAGFQMSFAAVIGLIAAYESRPRRSDPPDRSGLPGMRQLRAFSGWIWGIIATTVIASLAIGPFAAFHFQRAGHVGDLIANMLAVPIFGVGVVMPMLVSMVAMPFGLDGLSLTFAGWSVEAILAVAHETATWPIAVQHVPAMPISALGVLTLGGLWLALWTRRWRFWGLLAVPLGFMIAWMHPRPDVLVERTGTIIAVRDSGGRLGSSPGRSGTFSLDRWLQRDGEDAPASLARDRGKPLFACDSEGCTHRSGPGRLIAFSKTQSAHDEDCLRADILITTVPVRRPCAAPDVLIDRFDLWRNGAYALYTQGESIEIRHARGVRGERPWVLPRLRD